MKVQNSAKLSIILGGDFVGGEVTRCLLKSVFSGHRKLFLKLVV